MKCAAIHSTGSDPIASDIFHYGNWGEDDGILKIEKFLAFNVGFYLYVSTEGVGTHICLLNKNEELLSRKGIK